MSPNQASCALFAVIAIGCGASVQPASVPAATTVPECCAEQADLKRLDGKRVAVVGDYRPTIVMKGDPKKAIEKGEKPEQVAIDTASKFGVMLEVYYAPKGHRSAEELARFTGKRVRVVGVLHERTPSQYEGETVMATMIGPWVGEIESIEELR